MLGEKLRQLRLGRGMSEEDLSDRLDIPVDCLQDIEEGRRRLSRPTVKEVAQIFGVPEEVLLDESESRQVTNGQIPPEVTPEGIGKKIRELREERGMTLNRLSRESGISQAHLSEVERGLSSASLKTLEKISGVLEVSLAVLLGKEECDPLGSRVKRLRERMGLTQKELAEMVGASHALIGQIETGRLQSSVSTLTRLAGALGVSPCYFLIEEEDVPARGERVEPTARRALTYPEVQSFLAMLGELGDQERATLLGFLSWLSCRPEATDPECGAGCTMDPDTQEIMRIMKEVTDEDRQFLLETARFIRKKALVGAETAER